MGRGGCGRLPPSTGPRPPSPALGPSGVPSAVPGPGAGPGGRNSVAPSCRAHLALRSAAPRPPPPPEAGPVSPPPSAAPPSDPLVPDAEPLSRGTGPAGTAAWKVSSEAAAPVAQGLLAVVSGASDGLAAAMVGGVAGSVPRAWEGLGSRPPGRGPVHTRRQLGQFCLPDAWGNGPSRELPVREGPASSCPGPPCPLGAQRAPEQQGREPRGTPAPPGPGILSFVTVCGHH